MPQFMLLLRGGDAKERTPAEMQRIVEEYIAWARRLAAENRMVGGDELAGGGKVITGAGAALKVKDGPYTETKESVGGYFLIQAQSEAEAVEIAKECPGLARGGTVELRAIVEH
jgi:hypothetical protein